MSGKTWISDGGSRTDIVDGILERRGMGESESRRIFLNPSLREQMPDPFVLKGMESAAKIIAGAVRSKKKISVFGDYDVDGITGTAILIQFFRALGIEVLWHLPDRESEGYGLNEKAIRGFAARGAEVLITVDCGISAVKEVAVAKELGMTVVVTDHHEPTASVPLADAIVNPKQGGDESGLTYLAGVGVAFMFLIALNRELGHPVSDFMRFLDLVSLGTICDTMPLVGLNRAIVASGLKVLDKRQNIGLRVLMDKAGVRGADVYAAGFILGPRLNAAGRITDATLALDLILTDNELVADSLAGKLNDMNAKRQSIQNAILLDADERAKKQAESGAYCLYVSGNDWHGGVVGIVAGRLKEKYGRPCCIATKSGGIVNGSGRSIENVDLGKIIHAALAEKIIAGGGGHAAAAGFELDEGNETGFIRFLNENVCAALGGSHPVPKINIDAEMDAGGANWDLAENLSKLAPFGMGNSEPVLCLSGSMWIYGRTMGTGAHLSGTLKTSAGTLPVVGFNMSDSAIGRFLLDESNFGSIIRVVGKLKKNDYHGHGVQLFLEDVSL
ncbi:MAG: single-stranded-DNA-specific exonuclease RecJ [Rickettsiales bacterium]|jgi:single-stranded-DNA-specific exonuclease|nr:single-stranded-DNA-specific exonuclease RecJ [Rickettsiales bacterium]